MVVNGMLLPSGCLSDTRIGDIAAYKRIELLKDQ